MNFEIILFFLTAAVSVTSAVLMIIQRNPVKSVLFLIVNFFCLALLYLFLHAQFIAIIQILVYAGAIMVLFLFVIMLLNLGDESLLREKYSYKKTVVYFLCGVVFFEILNIFGFPSRVAVMTTNPKAVEIGTVEFIGKSLYTEYIYPFEITSMLLLAAIVGVIVLAKKKFQ